MRLWAVIDGRRAKRLATAVVLFSAVLGPAQEDRPSVTRNAPPPELANSTLTVKDMTKAFAKTEAAIRKVLHLPASAVRQTPKAGAAPATREQIVLQMDRIFELARPSFKFTPKKISFDPAMITIKKGSRARKAVEKLIAWECVGKVGPLAADLKPTMTLSEFGEELGFFIARLADLTHLPSNKWSPYLQVRPHVRTGTGAPKSSSPKIKP